MRSRHAQRTELCGRRWRWHFFDQCRLCAVSPTASDDDKFDEIIQSVKVVAVARVQRKFCGKGCRCNEQVYGSRPSCLSTSGDNRAEDPSVCASGINVERQRIERRLGALQAILSSCARLSVFRRVRSGGQLSHRDGADSDFPWKGGRVELLEVDDDGRV